MRSGLAWLWPAAWRCFGVLASRRRAGDTIKETTPALVSLAAVYHAVAALHA
jgi:hypothetical protein